MTALIDTPAPYTVAHAAPPSDVEGLRLWFETLLAQLNETETALRQTTPTRDDATRAILQRVQDRLEQAQRERTAHRYADARETIAAAYRILRLELHPQLRTRLHAETNAATKARLHAWINALDTLFEVD